jgi:diguanylate cyclase (GGDEF)-like protein
MRYRARYALIGFILGLGAPAGSLLWRVLIPNHHDLLAGMLREWNQASYFYIYMTIGTVTAFALFGYVIGWRSEGLNKSAITDGLTKIYNHRYLHERLDQEIERSDRYHNPLTCLMLDIDDFKKVNDQFGHPFGDKVLIDIARLIRETVRRTDLVGRYGGEEFLVIMPQATAQEALPIAQRIVSVIAEHSFVFKGIVDMRTTVSAGLATYPSEDHGVKSKSALLSAADQSLYKAKRSGKNKAVVWQA